MIRTSQTKELFCCQSCLFRQISLLHTFLKYSRQGRSVVPRRCVLDAVCVVKAGLVQSIFNPACLNQPCIFLLHSLEVLKIFIKSFFGSRGILHTIKNLVGLVDDLLRSNRRWFGLNALEFFTSNDLVLVDCNSAVRLFGDRNLVFNRSCSGRHCSSSVFRQRLWTSHLDAFFCLCNNVVHCSSSWELRYNRSLTTVLDDLVVDLIHALHKGTHELIVQVVSSYSSFSSVEDVLQLTVGFTISTSKAVVSVDFVQAVLTNELLVATTQQCNPFFVQFVDGVDQGAGVVQRVTETNRSVVSL